MGYNLSIYIYMDLYIYIYIICLYGLMSYIMLHIPLRAGTKIPQAMDVSSQANRGAYHPGEILSMTTTICPRGTRDRASWDSPRYADCHRTQSPRPVGQNYDEMVDSYWGTN